MQGQRWPLKHEDFYPIVSCLNLNRKFGDRIVLTIFQVVRYQLPQLSCLMATISLLQWPKVVGDSNELKKVKLIIKKM